MQLDRIERKYWHLIDFENGVVGAISNDGLLYMFESDVIMPKLAGLEKDKGGWYFNSTRDRYCAERTGFNRITVNPSKVHELFGLPLV